MRGNERETMKIKEKSRSCSECMITEECLAFEFEEYDEETESFRCEPCRLLEEIDFYQRKLKESIARQTALFRRLRRNLTAKHV